MNRDLETQLIKACIDMKSNKTTSLGSQEHRSDINKYRDEDRFNLEIDKIFKRQPFAVLHASELEGPNSYKSVDTPLGSLIVTRDADGQAHIFHNSCRHRGSKIVDGSGCNKRLVCPYHAWSYATDGTLSNVPGHAHCFPELDKVDNGLLRVPSVEQFGFIWACPTASDGSERHQLEGHFGEMMSHLRWMGGENLKVFARTSKMWKGNWKLFAEGGLETYHFAFAHKATIAGSFQNNIAVIDKLNSHYRVVMPTKTINDPAVLDQDYLSLREHSHTLFYLMPNTVLLVQENHVDWIYLRPVAVNKTEITITTLIPQDHDLQDLQTKTHWQKNHHITNKTLDEDWELGVGIQESVASGHLPFLRYGKNEWALQALNEEIESLLED